MNKIVLIWSFLFLKIDLASKFDFLVERSEIIRHQLSCNLFNFYNEVDPIPLKTNEIDIPEIPLTFSLLCNIAEYFDSDTLKSFANCSSTCHKFKNEFIAHRLVQFNRYFLFMEKWLNDFIYNFLLDHFPIDATIKSPQFHDFLALTTFKFVTNEFGSKNYIDFAIISFIHEIAFGPYNTYVPSSLSEWEIYYCPKIHSYHMPRTKNHYIKHLRKRAESSPNLQALFETKIKIYSFLSHKLDMESVKKFYFHNHDNISEYKFLFDTSWYNTEIHTIERIQELFKNLEAADASYFHLLETIKISAEIKLWIKNHFSIQNCQWFTSDLFKLHGISFKDPLLTYIYSRDLNNNIFHVEDLFSINQSHEFNLSNVINILQLVMRSNISFLIKFDIVGGFFRHKFINSEKYYNIMHCMIMFNSLKSSIDIDVVF